MRMQRIDVENGAYMKTATLAGIILAVPGVIALAYQGISYTTHKKVLDVGPIQAEKRETHTIPCLRY